jgi:hypothetical protein
MMYFIRNWDEDTVILFTQFGHVIGMFECVESAEDAARNHTADRRCINVFPLDTCTTRYSA